MILMNGTFSESPGRQFYNSKILQSESEPVQLELMTCALVAWSLVLLTVLLCDLPRLTSFLREGSFHFNLYETSLLKDICICISTGSISNV